MNASAGAAGAGLDLRSLGGQPAPPRLAEDLRAIASMPEAARARFWDALAPALVEPLPPTIEATLDAFSRSTRVDGDVLARALKAARFLLREACARGVDRERFGDDVVLLAGGARSPDAAIVAPLLLSGFEDARARLRSEMITRTRSDHGAVLETVEWRLDALLASSRGEALDAKLAFLTLGFRDGDRSERVTLQVSPRQLDELSTACERMRR